MTGETDRISQLDEWLLQTLMAIRDVQPKLVRDGQLNAIGARKLTTAVDFADDAPGGSDGSLLAMMVGVVREAGLVLEHDGRLIVNDDACGRFSAYPPQERREFLKDAWVRASTFNEFLTLEHLSVQRSNASTRQISGVDCVPGSNAIRRVRREVLNYLDNLDDHWVSIDGLLDVIQREEPDIMLPRATHDPSITPDYTGIRLRDGVADLARAGNWRQVEGALVRRIIELPLFVLGVVEIAHEGGEQLVRMRSESDDLPPSPPPAAQPCMVQPTYEVSVFLPECKLRTFWRLLELCVVRAWGSVTTLMLDEARVAHRINAGTSVSDIVAFLESVSRVGLAQNVRYSIEEWAQRTERIMIWEDAVVFELEGVENAEGVIPANLLEAASRRRASSRFVIADEGEVGAEVSQLPTRFARIDYSRTIPPTAHVRRDGVIEVDRVHLDFRLTGFLTSIAGEFGVDRWQLSAQKIAALAEGGATGRSILRQLESFCRTPLPPLVQASILGWAGDAGRASVQDVTVLTFEELEISRLLAEDPELEGLLNRPINARTYMVDSASAPKLMQALRDAGLEVAADPISLAALTTARADMAHVQESPAEPNSEASPALFLDLWRSDRAKAVEYATRQGSRLTLEWEIPGETGSRRETLWPSRCIIFPDGAWFEGREYQRGHERLINLVWITNARIQS